MPELSVEGTAVEEQQGVDFSEAAVSGDADAIASENTKKRPDWLPAKFWNESERSPRIDALARSYVELERKLSGAIARPQGEDDQEGYARLYEILGRPKDVDGYEITKPADDIQIDPIINKKLHDAGFTNSQAQLVYDLAANYLRPLMAEKMADLQAHNEVAKLQREFGGEKTWERAATQLNSWGRANLPQDVFDVLASSAEGVHALHAMMRNYEPNMMEAGADAQPSMSEAALSEMVRDPRYWRDRDPDFIAKVTAGFRELYAA